MTISYLDVDKRVRTEGADSQASLQAERELSRIPKGGSALVSRNLLIGGKRTSARLEPDMWSGLFEIARREGRSIHEICTMVSESKPDGCSLTAAIRVFITAYFRAAATEEGHARAGHGYGIVAYPDPVSVPKRFSLKNGTSGIPWR